MEWTAKAIDQLRGLWAEGHSTAEIGRRMGVTKNAIVGKAHRLDLSGRPSPIRNQGAAGTPAVPRRKPARVTAAAVPAVVQAAPPPSLMATTAPAPVATVRHFPRASARSCCWPLGEPGTRDFRFCGAEAASGKPYCTDHAAVAYVRVRDRRYDAA